MLGRRTSHLVAALVVLVAGGCGGGDERTVTETETVTVEAGASTDADPTDASEAAEATPPVGKEQTYTNVDEIEINGKSVDVTLRVRVSDLRTRINNPQSLEPAQGNRYVRMS